MSQKRVLPDPDEPMMQASVSYTHLLNGSCYYIGISAFYFGIPAETVIVEPVSYTHLSVVAQASGIIGSDASIDISSVMTDMESRLMDMDLGPLFGL